MGHFGHVKERCTCVVGFNVKSRSCNYLGQLDKAERMRKIYIALGIGTVGICVGECLSRSRGNHVHKKMADSPGFVKQGRWE